MLFIVLFCAMTVVAQEVSTLERIKSIGKDFMAGKEQLITHNDNAWESDLVTTASQIFEKDGYEMGRLEREKSVYNAITAMGATGISELDSCVKYVHLCFSQMADNSNSLESMFKVITRGVFDSNSWNGYEDEFVRIKWNEQITSSVEAMRASTTKAEPYYLENAKRYYNLAVAFAKKNKLLYDGVINLTDAMQQYIPPVAATKEKYRGTKSEELLNLQNLAVVYSAEYLSVLISCKGNNSKMLSYIDALANIKNRKRNLNRIVTVDNPGNVLSFITISDLNTADSLTFKGTLSDADILVISKCCQQLQYLDLADCNIVGNPELIARRKEEYDKVRDVMENIKATIKKKPNASLSVDEQMLVAGLQTKYIEKENAYLEVASCYVPKFNQMENLESLVLPQTARSIVRIALTDMPNLQSVVFPKNLIHIGEAAFKNCKTLESIEIDKCDVIEKEAFSGCAELKTAYLPSTAKRMGESVFYGCRELNAIKFPQGVEYIYSYCISDCISLRDIYIPSSVKQIDVGNDWDNQNVPVRYHFASQTPPVNDGGFKFRENDVLIVPKGASTAYFSAYNLPATIKITEE